MSDADLVIFPDWNVPIGPSEQFLALAALNGPEPTTITVQVNINSRLDSLPSERLARTLVLDLEVFGSDEPDLVLVEVDRKEIGSTRRAIRKSGNNDSVILTR